jgi:hypothetical protein
MNATTMKVAAVLVAALAALLPAQGQAMAEDIRVDCVTDRRIVCRDDETTCREVPWLGGAATYHFTFDLTKKTGSLVFCSSGSCMEPSPLSVVHDYCAFLRDYGAGCLISGDISVFVIRSSLLVAPVSRALRDE